MLAVLVMVAAAQACQECVLVDLSHWNQGLDFGAAATAGLQGVIHKATQGGRYKDKDFAGRLVQGEAAGLLWGAYHFGDGTATAQEQVDHFLSTVGPSKRLLALDFEPYNPSMSVEEAEKFVEAVAATRGKYPLLYGSSSVLKKATKDRPSSPLFKCPLWLAQWGPKAMVPPGWANWTIWQYTDGKAGPGATPVPGIGASDRDRYNPALYPSLQALWDDLKI